MISENAGKLADQVINIYKFAREFYSPSGELSKVKFGTSGHRGKLGAGFSCFHAEAIAQAVARMHKEKNITGPVLVGGDTRLMSEATAEICAEVLTANGLNVILADIALPTPVFSFEIISGRAAASLNGTASHNPPDDMGLKYNPSHGGPAGSDITDEIERYANEYLDNPSQIKKITLNEAKRKGLVSGADLISPYLKKLSGAVDLEAIKKSGLKIGIHSLGGASAPFYRALRESYGLSNLELVDANTDPTFGFIPLDHDGKIRMDPSSPYPMSPLLKLVEQGKYDFAGASDPDADRFGAATPQAGLVPPNHALSIALHYLLNNRPAFPANLKAARSIGTTHLIDRICAGFKRQTQETNVGFKYFVDGIKNGEYIMAGEESAGMSVYGWTTEKDGILAVMLLAEIMAKTGKDLAQLYNEITAKYGIPFYKRIDIPVDAKTAAKIKSLRASSLEHIKSIAGEKVINIRDTGGIKIYMENSWILARPSGTEPVAKLYAESFSGEEQLKKVMAEGADIFGLKL